MTLLPGIILAGGRAIRMGGGDKCLLPIADIPLLEHVIKRLSSQCKPTALNANGNPERFSGWKLPVLADADDDRRGPLAGVLAGLDWAAGQGAAAIVTVAADTPFFPKDLVKGLKAAAGPSGLALAASPDQHGRLRAHPTFGLWPVALRDDLRDALDDGLRKIVLWTDRHEAGLARWMSEPFDPFFNVNSPGDITAAEEIAALDRALHQTGDKDCQTEEFR